MFNIQEFIHPGSMLRECEYFSAKNMDPSADLKIQNGDFVVNVSIFIILKKCVDTISLYETT
jgi:hypothetical protein